MKVVYILAGAAAIMTVADIIAVKMSKNTEKRLNDKINDLAGVVKSMKKERIDDWFDSASDILTSHQDSIDDLEEYVIRWKGIAMSSGEDIVRLDKALHKDRKRIDDLESIASEKLGVIFKDEDSEEDSEEDSDETDN